jgi:Na+-transporting NADH:ubiquinone oxidoreductase subunit C
MNRDSNLYTFIFATIVVIVVAFALAFAATALKPMQDDNVQKEKMQNILSTIGVEVDRDGAQAKYKEYIKEQLSLKADGSTDASVNAFEVDLKNELQKPEKEQRFPIFIAEKDGNKYYIIPLRGSGLWDAIWGYVSLKSDLNTIAGTAFDHKGETPGLGAEITQKWFRQRFEGEKIYDKSGTLVGVAVQKGYTGGNNKDDNAIDAISGSTITGNGVNDMIKERLAHYGAYFKKQNIQSMRKN